LSFPQAGFLCSWYYIVPLRSSLARKIKINWELAVFPTLHQEWLPRRQRACLLPGAQSEILDVLQVHPIFSQALTRRPQNQVSDSVGGVKMQVEADNKSETNHRERIWFFPNKFWQATKGMPKEQVSQLMEEVEKYAEAKDVEALKKYPFVFVGDPYKDGNAA